jgi:uncharacterized membrane protein YphA (DoxX/SURF4 family)
MRTDARTILSWLLSLFLAFEFAKSGIAKLTSSPKMIASFHSFGYPLCFMYLTGCIEVVTTVLVLIPRTAALGAAIFACVMVGAIYAHLTHGQAGEIRLPAILLVASLALAWVRSQALPARGLTRRTAP